MQATARRRATPTPRRRLIRVVAQLNKNIGLVSIRQPYYGALIDMTTVTVSPKFQVVIPLAIRELFHLTAGEKLRVMSYGDRIELIPVRPIKSMRGFLKDMDSTIDREDDRL